MDCTDGSFIPVRSLHSGVVLFFEQIDPCIDLWASLVVQLVKNPPAMLETPLQFLSREDPLDEE